MVLLIVNRYKKNKVGTAPTSTTPKSSVTYPPKPTTARSKYSYNKNRYDPEGPTLRPYTPTLKPYTPTLAPYTVTTTTTTTAASTTTSRTSSSVWEESSAPISLDTGLFDTGEEETEQQSLDTGLFDVGVEGTTVTAAAPALPQRSSSSSQAVELSGGQLEAAKKPSRRVPIRDVLDIFQQLKLSFGKRQ